MAENKSDFIRDPQILKDQAKDMIEKLRIGFNLSIAKQPNINMAIRKGFGDIENPVIVFKDAVGDFSKMLSSDGWKYGVYYLQGSPKNGFHKMIDGKHIFIETHQEYSSLCTEEIKDADTMLALLMDKNPALNISNTHTDGLEKIEIGVPYLDHLEMPSTEWVYDAETGKIHSTSRPYSFEVVVTNAHNMNNEFKTSEGSSSSAKQRAALEEDNERRELNTDDVVVAESADDVNVAQKNNLDIDKADFSQEKMHELFNAYMGSVDNNGEFNVSSAEGSQDRRSHTLNLKENEQSSTLSQQEKEWLFMATLWVNACIKCGKEKKEQAFKDADCYQILGTIIGFLKTGERKADMVLAAVANLGYENGLKIAWEFLTSITVQAGYEIDFSNVDFNQLKKNQAEAVNEKDLALELKPQNN